jgi:hypothetical protein
MLDLDLNVFPFFPKITVSWLYDRVPTKCYIYEHRTNTSWLGGSRFHSWSSNLMLPLFFVVLLHIPLRNAAIVPWNRSCIVPSTFSTIHLHNHTFNDWTSFLNTPRNQTNCYLEDQVIILQITWCTVSHLFWKLLAQSKHSSKTEYHGQVVSIVASIFTRFQVPLLAWTLVITYFTRSSPEILGDTLD